MPWDNKTLATLKAMGGGSGGGGVSSWNDLTDKPFGTEYTSAEIVWDGNTEGLESVEQGPIATCKVSDLVLSPEQLIGQKLTLFTPEGVMEAVLTENEIIELDGEGCRLDFPGNVPNPVAYCIQYEGGLFSKGVWFANFGGKFYPTSLTYLSESIHPLDPKYLPMSDIINAVLDSIPTAEEASF